jgi:hypothetical protein
MIFALPTDYSSKSVSPAKKNHAKIFDLTSHMIAKKSWSKNALNVAICKKEITYNWANFMGN